MNNLAQLGCYTPFDDTKGIDIFDLQGMNENLGAIGTAIMNWNYNKLRQIEINVENTSITFPAIFIGEMAKNYLDLENVFSAINTPFLPAKFLFLRNVELKTNITDDKTLEFLKANMLRCEIVADIVEEVGDFLSGRQYKMNIYMDSDLEIFDFEKLILSIEVEEKDYNQVLKLWDDIEVKVERMLNNRKEQGYDASRIDNISDTLLIRIKRV